MMNGSKQPQKQSSQSDHHHHGHGFLEPFIKDHLPPKKHNNKFTIHDVSGKHSNGLGSFDKDVKAHKIAPSKPGLYHIDEDTTIIEAFTKGNSGQKRQVHKTFPFFTKTQSDWYPIKPEDKFPYRGSFSDQGEKFPKFPIKNDKFPHGHLVKVQHHGYKVHETPDDIPNGPPKFGPPPPPIPPPTLAPPITPPQPLPKYIVNVRYAATSGQIPNLKYANLKPITLYPGSSNLPISAQPLTSKYHLNDKENNFSPFNPVHASNSPFNPPPTSVKYYGKHYNNPASSSLQTSGFRYGSPSPSPLQTTGFKYGNTAALQASGLRYGNPTTGHLQPSGLHYSNQGPNSMQTSSLSYTDPTTNSLQISGLTYNNPSPHALQPTNINYVNHAAGTLQSSQQGYSNPGTGSLQSTSLTYSNHAPGYPQTASFYPNHAPNHALQTSSYGNPIQGSLHTSGLGYNHPGYSPSASSPIKTLLNYPLAEPSNVKSVVQYMPCASGTGQDGSCLVIMNSSNTGNTHYSSIVKHPMPSASEPVPKYRNKKDMDKESDSSKKDKKDKKMETSTTEIPKTSSTTKRNHKETDVKSTTRKSKL